MAITTTSPDPLRRAFLDAMSRVASTVAIATSDGLGGRAGATVSTLSAVSADETPSLLICLHRQTSICKAINTNKVFCLNILRASQQPLAKIFATTAEQLQYADKFEHADWREGWQKTDSGAWRMQNALASLDCSLERSLSWQSHDILIGKVREVVLDEPSSAPSSALLYADRRYRILAG